MNIVQVVLVKIDHDMGIPNYFSTHTYKQKTTTKIKNKPENRCVGINFFSISPSV